MNIHLHPFIELNDGKILTGKPDQFDGKNPWVSGVDFPNKTNPMIQGMNIHKSHHLPAINIHLHP